MRNIELLPTDENGRKIVQERRDKFRAYTGVAVDILNVDLENMIIKIRVEQKEVLNNNFYSQKDLVTNAKHLFDRFSGFRKHYVPLTFQPRFEVVDAHWVKERMDLFNLKSVDIGKHLGLDKSTVSILLSERRPLTKSQKAAFYYYFMVFELNKDFREFLKTSEG